MAGTSISVIIPVRNGREFLGPAIESATGQSLAPGEIIVVDDGSTDGSSEIARRHPGVRVIRGICGGAPAARNRGIDQSSGDLLAFLDQDDLWHPRKLELQAKFLADRPDLAAAVCFVQPFLSPGRSKPGWAQARWFEKPVPGWMPSCLVARRSAFEIVGKFEENVGESDTAWFVEARRAGPIVECFPETLVHWRVHGSNATGNVEEALPRLLRLCRAQATRNRGNSGS